MHLYNSFLHFALFYNPFSFLNTTPSNPNPTPFSSGSTNVYILKYKLKSIGEKVQYLNLKTCSYLCFGLFYICLIFALNDNTTITLLECNPSACLLENIIIYPSMLSVLILLTSQTVIRCSGSPHCGFLNPFHPSLKLMT